MNSKSPCPRDSSSVRVSPQKPQLQMEEGSWTSNPRGLGCGRGSLTLILCFPESPARLAQGPRFQSATPLTSPPMGCGTGPDRSPCRRWRSWSEISRRSPSGSPGRQNHRCLGDQELRPLRLWRWEAVRFRGSKVAAKLEPHATPMALPVLVPGIRLHGAAEAWSRHRDWCSLSPRCSPCSTASPRVHGESQSGGGDNDPEPAAAARGAQSAARETGVADC